MCVCVSYMCIYLYTVAYDYSLFFRLFILHEMISASSTDPLWQGYRLGKKTEILREIIGFRVSGDHDDKLEKNWAPDKKTWIDSGWFLASRRKWLGYWLRLWRLWLWRVFPGPLDGYGPRMFHLDPYGPYLIMAYGWHLVDTNGLG